MKFFSLTDVGRRREINEDSVYTSGTFVGNIPNLFIVADGMGGHNAGDYASQNTVKKVVEVIEQLSEEHDVENLMEKAIDAANSYIYKKSRMDRRLKGMGTTLVLVSCVGDTATIANVGDSRLYVVNDSIKQITRDHSLVEEMIELGGIAREEARNHPDKNIITRAIGVKEYVLVDFFELKLKKEDKLLLCSDGLTNMLKDTEIHHIISENKDICEAGKILVDKANENGGRDNISVVLVEPFGGQDD
ncbi:MAG: Stp1/IreP family PP2C-type Ser/Thr phosphatase [Lachnospiraceae bacterium]|nr:Stp1/IreP family PP2C-type Ser/Thr phosphatase [Lachnospiraceae bacterium]